jgi:transcriptional regulator with XRE-family HTH domain
VELAWCATVFIKIGPTVVGMRDITTTRGRELGAELRRIREMAGYNGHELAIRLGWSPSKISRLETGHTNVSEVDVTTYLVFCGIIGDELDDLLDLANEAENGYRLQPHGEQLPEELRTLVIEETSTVLVQEFESIYIPGLAQTEDYARALFRESGMVPEDRIERAVRTRMDRQGLLRRAEPPECEFYVHEQTLRAPVGSSSVMHEQILHLLFLDGWRHCSVRIVPTSSQGYGQARNAFRIMHYADHKPVIYVETQTASLFLEEKKDVDVYRTVLGMIGRVALDEGRSREFLARLASEYDRVDEGDDGPAWSAESGVHRLAQEQL